MALTTQDVPVKPDPSTEDSAAVGSKDLQAGIPALDQDSGIDDMLDVSMSEGPLDVYGETLASPVVSFQEQQPVDVPIEEANTANEVQGDPLHNSALPNLTSTSLFPVGAGMQPAGTIGTHVPGLNESQIEDLARHGLVVIEHLGGGGMGDIYLVTNDNYPPDPVTGIDPKFALKIVRENASVTARERFELEVHALALCDHPNLIDPASVGRFRDGTPFYTMPLMDGGTLLDLQPRLDREPMLRKQALEGMVGVLSALNHLHQDLGFVHRDLKPENLLLNQVDLQADGSLPFKIADLGITRLVNAPEAVDAGIALVPLEEVRSLSLTQADRTLGTPPYMSPEQIRGQQVDGRSDQYAVGVILFEIATGRLPHDQSSSLDLFHARLRSPAPDPLSIAPDLDPELGAVISRMLERDPSKRFANTEEAATALKAALDRLPEDGGFRPRATGLPA